MSKAGTFAGTVLIAGQGRQQSVNLGPVTNASSPGQITAPTLSSGDNLQTSSVSPVAQIGVFISPRPGQGYGIGVRSANTDSIIPLDAIYPSFIPIDPSVTTWLLNSTTSGGIVDLVTV